MNGTSSSPEPSYWTNFHLQRACYKTSQLGERHPYASIPFTQGITIEKKPFKNYLLFHTRAFDAYCINIKTNKLDHVNISEDLLEPHRHGN